MIALRARVISGPTPRLTISSATVEGMGGNVVGGNLKIVPQRAARSNIRLHGSQQRRTNTLPAMLWVRRQRQKLGLIRNHPR